MALSASRRAMLKQQESAKKEVAAVGGGGDDGMDWLEKYVDKLDKEMSEVKVSLHGMHTEMLDMRVEMKQNLKGTEDRITAILDRNLTEMRERDAQRHAEILTLSTKFGDEIKEVKADIKDLRKDLNTSAQDLRKDLNTSVQDLRKDLNTSVQDLRKDLNTSVQDLRKDFHKDTKLIIRWVMGFTVTIVISFVSILATLLRH